MLGPLLLILAAIGIYAVVSYSISRRTVEIGVRHALGASSNRIVIEIIADTLRAIGMGALIGWIISLLVEVRLPAARRACRSRGRSNFLTVKVRS